MVSAMIRQIAPQFFTTDLPATLAYYKDRLGFECLSIWHDPPVYAIVARTLPLRRVSHALSRQVLRRAARRLLVRRKRGRSTRRVLGPRCRARASAGRHTLAGARICREGLRRP